MNIFKGIKKVYKVILIRIIVVLGKVNISKRIMLFTLILIISIIGITSYQLMISYTNTIYEAEFEDIRQNLALIDSQLNAEKSELKGIAETLAKAPIAREIIYESDKFSRTLWNYIRNDSGLDGIEIRDFNFDVVAETGTLGVDLDSDSQLKRELEGIMLLGMSTVNITFLTQTRNYIRINSISSVIDEFQTPGLGSILITRSIGRDFLSNMPLGRDYTAQLYYGDSVVVEQIRDDDLRDINLMAGIDEFDSLSLQNMIQRRQIKGEEYLMGILPIRDFNGNVLGNFAIVKSSRMLQNVLFDLRRNTIQNAIFFIILSVVFVTLIALSITYPMNNLIKATKKIAAGDLSIEVKNPTKDQFSILTDNFNNMISSLKEIVLEVNLSSKKVNEFSQQLSANSEEANASIEEVAAASEEIASGTAEQAKQSEKTRELTIKIETDAQNVYNASDNVIKSVRKAYDRANFGLETITGASNYMEDVLKEMQDTGDEVLSLEERINEINKIIETINYINEETTLLSLNAQIEAARAGEYGRGFAVVADEVGKLADQSNSLMKEIDSIFDDINQAMKKVVSSSTNSAKLVKEGENEVKKARELFNSIQVSIDNALDVTKEILEYVEKQKEETDKVSLAIDEVSNIAEINAEGAEQTSQTNEDQVKIIEGIAFSANELSDMAKKLQRNIEKFKLD
ncbi:MAG TPA: methyl-accepting chemotaxis protein [Halanaerobiales bacterium]|nr:methyl-accepting chemotaxis protein [Halanaerobiales bacterium]